MAAGNDLWCCNFPSSLYVRKKNNCSPEVYGLLSAKMSFTHYLETSQACSMYPPFPKQEDEESWRSPAFRAGRQPLRPPGCRGCLRRGCRSFSSAGSLHPPASCAPARHQLRPLHPQEATGIHWNFLLQPVQFFQTTPKISVMEGLHLQSHEVQLPTSFDSKSTRNLCRDGEDISRRARKIYVKPCLF